MDSGQPKAINRQADGDNFNLFMGRANNVTDPVRPEHARTLRDSFIGHTLRIRREDAFNRGRTRKAKLAAGPRNFLWDVPPAQGSNKTAESPGTTAGLKRQDFLGHRKICPL
jgi:hypothetical protein